LATIKKNIPLHPFLLAIYPVLALWNTNIKDVAANQITRAIFIVLVISICLFLVLYALVCDWLKAGLILSVLLIAFFSYGHIYAVLRESGLSPLLVRHRILLPLISIIACCFVFPIWKNGKSIGAWTNYFNVFGVVLIIMLLFQLASYELRSVSRADKSSTGSASSPEASSAVSGKTPDIYYIILDGYGRQDILSELYGYDNSAFLNDLKKRGFYIAENSYTNYMQTVISLSSSLNMAYIDELNSGNGGTPPEYETYLSWMHFSKVRDFLRQRGYKTVAFATAYAEMGNADIFFKAPYQQDSNAPILLPINEFEGLLLKSTMARAWLDLKRKGNNLQDSFLEAPYIKQRNRILFTLTEVEKVPAISGKKFVFAHVVAPHPPFVFGPNGEAVNHTLPYELGDGSAFDGSPEEYVTGYRNQIQYINKLVLQAIDAILASSPEPPVIIIQGDHGPGAHLQWSSVDKSNIPERMAILNAYYFPDGNYDNLYPSISPVNSFRVILNKYFGTEMKLLPDNHYFSTYSELSKFINVNDRLGIHK
jgi:hypothetical protein